MQYFCHFSLESKISWKFWKSPQKGQNSDFSSKMCISLWTCAYNLKYLRPWRWLVKAEKIEPIVLSLSHGVSQHVSAKREKKWPLLVNLASVTKSPRVSKKLAGICQQTFKLSFHTFFCQILAEIQIFLSFSKRFLDSVKITIMVVFSRNMASLTKF